MRANQFHFAIRKFAPFEHFLKERWQEYCQQTGCTLELVPVVLDLPELHRQLLTENGLKNGNFDLALISSDWMKEAIGAQAVLPIESLVQKTATAAAVAEEVAGEVAECDFFEPWPSSLLRAQKYKEQHYGVPFHDGPECLIYRKDLFEDPKHCQAFFALYDYPLEAPKNWENFHDIARYFQATQEHVAGTALAAYPDGHNAVYDFCIQAWTRGATFIAPDGAINFKDPAIQQGLAFYRSLVTDKTAIHKDSLEMDSVKLGVAFAKGELAMMINWFGFATYAAQVKDSPVAGKIAVAPIPYQTGAWPVAPNSYWVYGIGSGSSHAAIVLDFIRFATTAKCDVQLTLSGGIGCHKSTWHDRTINAQLPFFSELETLHAQARELPDTEQWPAVAKIIDELMTSVATTKISIEDLLTNAQNKVDTLQIQRQ